MNGMHRAAGRQRGSVLVAAAAALGVSVALLGVADVGYLFYMKREFQKTVDLAALAGAQALEPADCGDARVAAAGNAQQHVARLGIALPPAAEMVHCGRWDPSAATMVNEVPADEVYGGKTTRRYFGEPAPAAGGTAPHPFNAVRVTLRREVPALLAFLGTRTIDAEAIATRDAPVAAFSVGSRLVRLANADSLTYRLLTTLGLQPNQIKLLDWEGLARVNVKPSGLLSALGLPTSAILDVGTPQEAVGLQELKLGQLLEATATALGAQAVATAQVQTLQALHVALAATGALNVPVRLFGSPGSPGVLADVALADRIAALGADVNVMELVGTSLALANGDNLIDANVSALGLVTAKLRVVEPPSIAIGGVGAQAHSAQVRLYVRVATQTVPLLGWLLDRLQIRLDLPVVLEVASSTGTLTRMCQAPLAPRQADIDVTSSVVNICLGRFSGMDDPGRPDFFSSQSACNVLTERHTIANIVGLLPVRSKMALSVLPSETQPVRLTAPVPPDAPAVETVTPRANIDLARLGRDLAQEVGNGLLGDLLGGSLRTEVDRGTVRDTLAQSLLGPSPGRSLSAVQYELNTSAQSLEGFARTWASGNVLGGVLQLVGGLLNTVGALLGDVVCLLGGYTCKVNYVKGMIAGDSAVSAVLGVVVDLLEPLLNALSSLLQHVINNVLGLGVGETDVSLHSVACGNARLVY